MAALYSRSMQLKVARTSRRLAHDALATQSSQAGRERVFAMCGGPQDRRKVLRGRRERVVSAS